MFHRYTKKEKAKAKAKDSRTWSLRIGSERERNEITSNIRNLFFFFLELSSSVFVVVYLRAKVFLTFSCQKRPAWFGSEVGMRWLTLLDLCMGERCRYMKCYNGNTWVE